jgi:hypothetical protein
MRKRGILYVATGQRYIEEMLFSAQSVKAVMPNFPITVFTNDPSNKKVLKSKFIDSIHLLEDSSFSYGDKIAPMLESPYDETLYLDTDTVMIENCEDIFAPLKCCDLAVTHNAYRVEFSFEEIPSSFPAYNTGVIAFGNTSRFRSFVRCWKDAYKIFAGKTLEDQPSFRHCVYHSNIDLHILPGEYNFFPYFPSFIGGYASVKIVHSSSPHAFEIARIVNRRSRSPAVYGPINPIMSGHWYWVKIRKALRRYLRLRWR